jgi:hypothetical protein
MELPLSRRQRESEAREEQKVVGIFVPRLTKVDGESNKIHFHTS